MKVTHLKLALILFLVSISISVQGQETDDDFLLSILPAIAASANDTDVLEPTPPTPLELIQRLKGRWKFVTLTADSEFELTTYFRFNSISSGQIQNSGVYFIYGESSVSEDFYSNWCGGGLAATYSAELQRYLILCDWGYPDYDLGTAYFFQSVANQFSYDEYYYLPSSSELSTGISQKGRAKRLSPDFKPLSKGEGNPTKANRKAQLINLNQSQKNNALKVKKKTKLESDIEKEIHRVTNALRKLGHNKFQR